MPRIPSRRAQGAGWPAWAMSGVSESEGEGAVLMPCVCRAVYSPVSGEIVEANDALGDEPGERGERQEGQKPRAK